MRVANYFIAVALGLHDLFTKTFKVSEEIDPNHELLRMAVRARDLDYYTLATKLTIATVPRDGRVLLLFAGKHFGVTGRARIGDDDFPWEFIDTHPDTGRPFIHRVPDGYFTHWAPY